MISRIALALSIVLLAAGCLMPGAPEKEPLVAVSNFLHPPFSSKDADGRPVGIEVEFVEEAARRLGRRVEWREMAFGELIDAVFWGKADIAGATIGITDGRMKRVAFSNPYYRTNIVALTRPGAGEPRTLEALRGRRVATDKGTTAVAATAKRIPEAIRVTERLPGKTWAELLLAGEVDAIVLDQSHVEKFSADAGAELVEIAEPLREEVFGLVVGKSARELREALNEVIAEEATQLDTKPTAPSEFETVGTLVGVSASSAQYQPGYFSDDHKQALSITGKRTLVLKDRKRRNPVAPWN
jgi:ABC-type amino acid transport substrate-binding protein